MRYTLRNIPPQVDHALRERSAREGKSLNAVVTEALARGLNLEAHPVKRRDLRTIAGSWVRDRDVERALDEQRVIDLDPRAVTAPAAADRTPARLRPTR